ncbi:hypothetical protein LEP1GSC125_0272 [Leptospira mayottensis 200901122]|uniref:Uncharacterized protein n=1 Tax=Leptospira mayottensis 200901122 TaxID=1193010 RepID=A0AA87SYL4_9LEPT|nr:hypothetical protein LEP1GSC125_0272 [Leptospira mayottensis 200901122]
MKNQDENSPMAILKPNEKIVAKMLATRQGLKIHSVLLNFFGVILL